MLRIERSGSRALHLGFCATLLAVFVVVAPAEAQRMIIRDLKENRARLSGFVWHGDLNGTIDVPVAAPAATVLEDGIDVRETLGLGSGATGWAVDMDVALSRRHRFLFAASGLQHSGVNEFEIPLGDDIRPFEVIADSRISIRAVHGAYNFLFVSTPAIDAGAIGGVGYFSNTVAITSNIVEVSEEFTSAYPVIGANVLLKSEDILSIYAEFTGFPNVSVGDFSGFQSQLTIQFLVYPAPSIGLSAGYERYQLSLDDDGSGVAIDFVWDGFIVGVQYRF